LLEARDRSLDGRKVGPVWTDRACIGHCRARACRVPEEHVRAREVQVRVIGGRLETYGIFQRPRRATPRSHEEIVLGWALVLLGGMRIVVALVSGETWAAEATIAALMMLGGVRLLTRR